MTSAFLKVKKNSSWRPSVSKGEVRCLCPCPLARNRTKRILRWKWTLVAPVIVTSESIKPNDNDSELNAVAYAFSKIFQPETCWNVANKFSRSFGDQELLSFVGFPFRCELRNEESTFSCCGRFRSVLVVFTNTKTFMEGERKYTRSTTKKDFPGELFVKTKHLSLTSLAFM